MPIRTILLSSVAVSAAATATPAMAREVDFAISPGALAPAITAFSRAAAIDVMADPALLRHRATRGVNGQFNASDGLAKLLDGTGLTYRQRNGGFIIVSLPRPAVTAPRGATAPAVASPAYAAPESEEITVTGQRGANQDAIAIKRRERNIVDAISSDEAQRLPDLTIVNAMRRIPGVSVLPVADNEHPRDEAIAPVLRGLNQSYNNVTINGLPIASPGIPNSGSGNPGRGVRLDILPTSLVKQIVVIKTFTPDLDPNAVGGAVDLRMRSAFDGHGRPFLTVDAGLANSSQKGLPQPQEDFGRRLSATASTTFGPDRKFGVVLSGNYQRLQNYTEVHATSDSTHYNFYNNAGQRVTDGTFGNGIAVPQQDKSWYNQSDRERWSVTGRLEAQLGQLSLYGVGGIYKFIDGYDRNEIVINGRNGPITNQTPASGRYAAASVEIGYRTGRTISETQIFQGGLEWWASSVDQISVRGSLSKASSREPHDMVKYNGGVSPSGSTVAIPQFSFDYDTSKFHHSFNLNPDAYYNLSLYKPVYWRNYERKAGGRVNSIRADWSHRLDEPGFGLSAGISYTKTLAYHDWSGEDYTTTDRNLTLSGIGSMSPARLSFNRSGLRLITIDNARAWAQFAANRSSISLEDDEGGNIDEDFDHTEKQIGGYVLANYTSGPLKLLGGLRLERTDIKTLGWINVNDEWRQKSTSSNYRLLLPSALLSYDLTRKLRVRAGFSQTIGRPSYESYAARSTIRFENPGDAGNPNAEDVSVQLGNPDIRPRRSDNYDLSFEWSVSNQYGGMVSLGLFNKAIRDEIYDARSVGYTYGGIHYVNASVVAPANASTARIRGFELSAVMNSLEFLSPILANFGFNANWSILDGKLKVPTASGATRSVSSLLGQPSEIRNLSVFYSNAGFELRGAYNWTGRALRSIVPNTYWQDVYWAPREQFDLQARYAFGNGFSIVAEASNLTQARTTSVTGPNRNLLKDSYSVPRTIWLSLGWTPGRR